MPIRNETITITTGAKSGGSYDGKGRWAAGAVDEPIPIEANVQPLNGREILQLPESDRTRQTLKIYSDEALPANSIVTRSFDGLKYEVLKRDHWIFQNIPHYKAFVALVDNQNA
jgi:hypothetical protein